MNIASISSDITALGNNSFWQANIWGIIGTISGLVGLIVSYISFQYNTPKIEVEEIQLTLPNWSIRDWKNKTLSQLDSCVLKFEIEILVRNARGGSGSIEKPVLLIQIPIGKKFGLISQFKNITLKPITEHTEYEKESENVTKIWTERHGKAFNLTGGETRDEKLTYQTYRNPSVIFDYVNNCDNAKYFIEYSDNSGKKSKTQIHNISNENPGIQELI